MSVLAGTVEVATPAGAGGILSRLVAERRAPAFAARLAASSATFLSPLRIGQTVVVARHAQVVDVLARDAEFRIAPINAARMDAVNGPFILGMDRGVVLAKERGALYRALADFDFEELATVIGQDARHRILQAAVSVDVVNGYARPLAAATARRLFGVGGAEDALFQDVARAIFAHTFLNAGGDATIEARALRAAALMREWLTAEIQRRRETGAFGADMMGALLRHGTLDSDGVRRTLGGMLVGAIDTTASTVAKIVAMLGRSRALAARVGADVDAPDRLAGWCRELLRFWPHNPIILRSAAVDTQIDGTPVQAGDRIVLWTQAAMLDAAAFPDPGTARPDRPAGAYLHFGGGLHPCAGRAINAVQIPILVATLVRRGIRSVGPISWAGPFPDHLALQFGR